MYIRIDHESNLRSVLRTYVPTLKVGWQLFCDTVFLYSMSYIRYLVSVSNQKQYVRSDEQAVPW